MGAPKEIVRFCEREHVRLGFRVVTAAVAATFLVMVAGASLSVTGGAPALAAVGSQLSPGSQELAVDQSVEVDCGSGLDAPVVVDRRRQEGWVVRATTVDGHPCAFLNFTYSSVAETDAHVVRPLLEAPSGPDLWVDQVVDVDFMLSSYVYGFAGPDVADVRVRFAVGPAEQPTSAVVADTHALRPVSSKRVFVVQPPEAAGTWRSAEALDPSGAVLDVVVNADLVRAAPDRLALAVVAGAIVLVVAIGVWLYRRSSRREETWRREHPDHRPPVDPGSDYGTYGGSGIWR